MVKRIENMYVNVQILNPKMWSISHGNTLNIKTDNYHVKAKIAINFI